jgi:hypothetical protein
MGGTGGTLYVEVLLLVRSDRLLKSKCDEEAVWGRGVDVAAGVVGESGFCNCCCWSLAARSWFVVMKEASEREWTLTRESEAEDAWSEEDLRWRCEGARRE